MLLLVSFSCSSPRQEQKAEEPKKPAPAVLLRPKPRILTPEQREALGFLPEVIARVESAAGAAAEPFFEEVQIRSANLKGDAMISQDRLSGFSVRTPRADELIAELSPAIRPQGYLIFRSEQNFGSVPDVVTVVRGNNSYDILKVQKTEAPHYQLDTAAIITWLRQQQKLCSFVVIGAGADWVEARFIAGPKNMNEFAQRVAAFAPDVLSENGGSVNRLVERMRQANGFYLSWD